MRNSVGLYFGSKAVSIVETRNRKIVNTLSIPMDKLAGGEFEEKIPQEVKIVAVIRDELRKTKIEAEDLTVVLPGRDLIIRTFEMPVLPKEEILSAINFEAKKYIPFKSEDLIFDFQMKLDRSPRRNQVLFFGIKKEVLDKYVSVISQLGLKVQGLEYSAFSQLRLSNMVGGKKRGVTGVTYVDLEEESNFMVLEDGFPLFSRDIDLTFGIRPEEIQTGLPVNTLLEKLKGEIRISLDYYRRKFPTKKIEKVILFANPVYKADIEKACQDVGAQVEFADANKYFTKDIPYSMGFVKAYSAALAVGTKSNVNLDFMAAKDKALATGGMEMAREVAEFAPGALRVDPRFIAIAAIGIIATFMFTASQIAPLRQEIDEVRRNRITVAGIDGNAPYSELEVTYSKYSERINSLEDVLRQQIYLTEELNTIPTLLPKGVWLTEATFQQSSMTVEFVLKGQAYLDDRDTEFETINNLTANLKNNPVFSKTFSDITMSIDRSRSGDYEVTSFTIYCRLERKRPI